MNLSKLLRIRGDHFLRSSLVLLVGAVSSQGLILVSSPLLTRTYSQADFGIFAIFLSSVSILSTTITLRYELGIVTQKTYSEALRSLKAALFLTTLLGLLLLLLALLLWKASLFPANWSFSPLMLSIIAGITTAQLSTLSCWWNRCKNFKRVAILKVVQSIGITLTSLGLGYFGWHYGLLFGQTAGILLTLLLSTRLLWRLNVLSHPEQHLTNLKKNINFPKYLLVAASIDMLSMQLPIYLITYFFNTTISGEYSLAWRVLTAPVTLVSTSFGQVFFQYIARARVAHEDIKPVLVRAWLLLFGIGLIPFSFLFLYGPDFFSWAFGEKWHHAGQIATIITPMLFSIFISSPTSTFYIVAGLQKYSLIFSTASFFYRSLAICIGNWQGSIELALWLLTSFEIAQIAIYNTFGIMRLKNQTTQ